MNDLFQVETHWQAYLVMIGIKEEMLSPTQHQEMKRAFYGGFGQMLVLFRDNISLIEDNDEGIKVFMDITKQVHDFWVVENNKHAAAKLN